MLSFYYSCWYSPESTWKKNPPNWVYSLIDGKSQKLFMASDTWASLNKGDSAKKKGQLVLDIFYTDI